MYGVGKGWWKRQNNNNKNNNNNLKKINFLIRKKVFYTWGCLRWRWRHIWQISCNVLNIELTWRLFTPTSFRFPIACSNMAASNNNNNRYMWTNEETKNCKWFLQTCLHCQVIQCQGVYFFCFLTTTFTFYYNHVTVRCLYHHLLTKLAQFICSNQLMETCLITFFFSFFANFQKICFTLRWRPGYWSAPLLMNYYPLLRNAYPPKLHHLV